MFSLARVAAGRKDERPEHLVPELYIMRHGQTEWNLQGRYQGWLDSPLTELGRAQARRMGQTLAARGVSGATHSLRASPSGRTRNTAQLAFPGGSYATDENLREIDMGSWSGLSRDDLRERGLIPDDMEMLDFYASVPDGESFSQMWDRAGAALAALQGPSVLVTHGITSRFLRARAVGLPLDRLGELEGGQGVIFHVRKGRIEKIVPSRA